MSSTWMAAAGRGAATLLLALATISCGGSKQFLDPEADLPFYEKVGILPFESLASDRAAGERVSHVFFNELLRVGFAQVAEPGQFAAATVRVRGGKPVTSPWSTEDLAKLGEELGVQGVFLGTVVEYEMVRIGRDSFPMVSLEVRLVDTESGRLVWSANRTEKEGPGLPLLDWGGKQSLTELSAAVIQDMLRPLGREVGK
jgi:TolB-like protein